VLTTESAATRYGVSAVAAHRALTELADAGILGRSKNHKGRIVGYTADAHLGLTTLAERANRVGAGDTDHRRPDQGSSAPAVDRFGQLRTDSPE
jgi:CTP-dependent riboflavin kinase